MCKEIPPHPNVMPGWGCCQCALYNDIGRWSCRGCGHIRCDKDPKDYPFPLGRFRGWKLGRIYEFDPEYVTWASQYLKGEPKVMCRKMLKS